MASRSLEMLLREKKKSKKKLIKQCRFVSNSTVCVINIQDDIVRNFLIDGLGSLGVACLVTGDIYYENFEHIYHVDHLSKEHLLGADFFVYDNLTKDVDVLKLLSYGIVPIMPEKNNFRSLLKQFNPIAFSGNSFLYEKQDKYNIFASVVSLLENMKFPADYKMLLKNISEATY